MTRKKSNVKALALAVTCAILAGGGIGLNPVYAADALTLYKEASGNVTTSAKTGTTDNTVINELTVGGVTIGSSSSSPGISVGDSSGYVHITKTDVHASNSLIAPTITTGFARMENGNIIAQDSLRIGYEYDNATNTYKKIKFEVDGNNGSFKAAGDKFTVDGNGAITADSLTLGNGYNVQQNIEGAKARITTVENDLTTNKNNLNTLTGRVDGHDTNIDELQKKTQGITRGTDDSTTVDGVNFKEGAVSGVKSINDNLKFESDGIYLNKGDQTKQIKIDNDGKIIIGTSSSAYDTNGFYAGGDDYNAAKAGMKSDGSLKAAGGAFTVDTAGKVTTTGDIQGADITATGALKGASLDVTGDISTNGSVTAKGGLSVANGNFTVDGANGDTTVKGKLDVTGNITGADITAKGALKGQTLGIGAANTEFVVDANGNITKVTSITADENKLSTIGGVKLEGKNVTADNLEIGNKITTKDLEVTNSFIVGDFTTNNLKVNNTLTVGTNTTLTEGELVLGTDAKHTLTKAKLKTINDTINDTGEIETTKATIGVHTTIDSTGIRSNSVTADTGTIGGITLNSNNISGVTKVTAGEFYVDTNNNLNSSGITAKGGKIGEVTIVNKEVKADKFTAGASSLETGNLVIDSQNSWTAAGIKAKDINAGSATIGTNTKIDGTGIETNKVTLGDMTIINGNNSRTNGVTINGVELKTNAVTASGGFTVDTKNKLDATGLTAKAGTFADSVTIGSSSTNQTKVEQGKITVKGNPGRSTAAGTETTIDGGIITTDTLNVQRIELGEKLVDSTGSTITDSSIYLNHDGSFGAAKGAFQIDKDGQVENNIKVSGTDASETTFTSSKTGITAKYRKGTGTATSGLTIEDNHAALNASGGAALDLNDKTAKIGSGNDSLTTYTSDTIESKVGTTTVTTKSGGTTFGDGTANNTLINGSSITSTKDGTSTTINGSSVRSYSATGAGHLNGATLNLWKDSDNATYMTAGGATFIGKKGDSSLQGNKTTIDGGVITTDTLNVERINLGGELYDKNGTSLGGNLSMEKDGNFSAAGGNFTVKGGTATDRGALHNEVGKTSLDTTETGASMKYKDGGVESKVTVEANKATVAAGDKASFVATTDNGGTATITGGTQTVTTTDKGTVFENSAHKTAFVTDGATNTIINGNEITTGKITTDQLVIKGNGSGDTSGDGGESGSIAFGGDGTITSNIKDGANETTFKTTADGVSSEVNNGTYTSNVDQSADRIGSVITGGNVKIGSVADASLGVLQNGAGTVNAGGDTVTEASQTFRKDGSITSVAKDAAGKSSQLVQNGTGLVYTDSANTGNATRINSSDVSIGSATDPDKRINLSDLGQIDNLDDELKNRPEYKNGEEVGTAVGAINAEAGIRREEVARLDNRIDDVNNRVDKVGAMAAAIASLKSIGYDPQAPSEFSIGLGQYKGETGVAMGFFHYPNKNFMINVSLSTAGGETMGGIGATWRFGHKSPQKLLEEQREAQAKKELAAAEKYQAAAKLAKEAQERAEYAAKLARQAQVSADNAKAAADATQAKHFG